MNELPTEKEGIMTPEASNYNPFWTFINNKSVRIKNNFDRPIITQKRRPKIRTKRFYTENELKTYKQKDLLRIATFNNIKYEKKNRQKQKIIELLLKKPIQIPHLTNIEETEKKENVKNEVLEVKKRYEEVKEKINEMITNKEIQTEEKFIKVYETDIKIYELSNFNRKRIFNKKKQKYNKPTLVKNQMYSIFNNKKIIHSTYMSKFIANNFIRKVKDNENIYNIDRNKFNNNVNNLLILLRSEILIITKIGIGEEKNKKGGISKMGNAYVFRYLVNKNAFSKSFNTKEEAKTAQLEYQKKIDDIENPFNSLSVLDLSFHTGKTLKKIEIK